MKLRYLYIFSVLTSLCLAPESQAQEQDGLTQQESAYPSNLDSLDSLEQNIDSLSQDTLNIILPPQAVPDSLHTQSKEPKGSFVKFSEIYLDYGKLATIPFGSELKAELGAGIYFRFNFGINIEVGYGAKYPEDFYKNTQYESKGYYGRVGLNYLLTYVPGVHLSIGAKYGYSMYEYEGTYELGSDFWGNYTNSFHRTNLQADWFEIAIGSERRWKGNFYLGFVVRLRVLRNYDTFTPIEVYSIPGYGRTVDKSSPALNLYIKYIFGNRIDEEEPPSE